MENTRASTWFRTAADFRQVCGDALSLAKGEKAEEFAHAMMEKANQYGLDTFVTPPQLKWLCQIADTDVPPRRP